MEASIAIAWALLVLFLGPLPGEAIDCFKCVSYNGSAPWCEDPFHHNFSTAILETACQNGRKGRQGLYPATSCVKIHGIVKETGESMFIRDCSLDSGSLTSDTELVRMSHCGAFYYDSKYVIGCVQACEVNACNAAVMNTWHSSLTSGILLVPILMYFRY